VPNSVCRIVIAASIGGITSPVAGFTYVEISLPRDTPLRHSVAKTIRLD